jgi:predicted O-methyltransferase YrrM
LNKFSFYTSFLKYVIKHPKIGVQVIETAYQAWNDSRQNIIMYDDVSYDLNHILQSICTTEFSLAELKKNLTSLENYIITFIDNISNTNFPSKKKPYPLNYSVDNQTGLLLYALCRITKPEKVVETGVAYGLSSVYILQALHDNQKGKLYSIDYIFRPWESKEMIGALIPDSLRSRWELIFGVSSEKLQNLLKSLESVDMFIHDSQHTFKNMLFEFKTAWPFVKKNGFLLSDDILNNNAFHIFCSSINLKPLVLKQEGSSKSYTGILQKI